MQEFLANSLTFSIANIGVNPATSVSIRIPEQENFRVIGAGNIFLGNLNPGDSTVATFNVAPVTSAQGNNATGEMKVEISYTDTSGLRQTADSSLVVKASTESQNLAARNQQRGTGNLLYYIVAIVAIVAFGFFIYRRRKKKH